MNKHLKVITSNLALPNGQYSHMHTKHPTYPSLFVHLLGELTLMLLALSSILNDSSTSVLGTQHLVKLLLQGVSVIITMATHTHTGAIRRSELTGRAWPFPSSSSF